jgi:hypothetical protein
VSGIAILILIVLRNIADIGQAMNESPIEKHTNKPDWSIFANIPKVPLWTAVCLSMDLDPNLEKPQEYFGHDWCDLQKIEYYRPLARPPISVLDMGRGSGVGIAGGSS